MWQDIFSKQNVSKEELINKSMIAIKNNFSLEKMCTKYQIIIKNQKIICFCCQLKDIIININKNYLIEYFVMI